MSSQIHVRAAVIALRSRCGASGRGQGDQAPPVATVSLTTKRALRSALGSSDRADLPVRGRAGRPIAGDYRVFVHVESRRRHDDLERRSRVAGRAADVTVEAGAGDRVHAHPVRAGVFVPRRGHDSRWGLYQDNERLPLDRAWTPRIASPGAVVQGGDLELLPRSESIQVIRLSGWHPGEYATEDPTIEWQWRQKLATLSSKNPRRDVLFYLEYDGRPDLFSDKPQTGDGVLSARRRSRRFTASEPELTSGRFRSRLHSLATATWPRYASRSIGHSFRPSCRRQPGHAGTRHPRVPRLHRAPVTPVPARNIATVADDNSCVRCPGPAALLNVCGNPTRRAETCLIG